MEQQKAECFTIEAHQRMVKQRSFIKSLDSLFLTMMIDTREDRDVMTADTPNAFVQTPIKKMDTDDKTVMKITGVLVDLLVTDSPAVCGPCVACEGHKKALCVEAL